MPRASTSSNILMELRKICQHPYLCEPEMEDRTLPEKEQHRRLVEGSGKLKFLKLLLPELKERGFRVLLFSQFKIALDVIEDFLYGEGYKYLRLDGDVAQVNRQKDMDKFNAPGSDYFIFLLTTRAGGVGINLATADAVIMFDPDFNPHQDLQAISRSHRYGQKKRVLVFRLMAENSVESRILNSGKRKMVLDHLVVQQMGKETEEGEVDSLILYGAEEIAKSNPDDMSHDRVWTKQLVNELIDGAEKEAEQLAKEQAERDAAEAAGEDVAAENAKAGFSFARVWETKTHQFSKDDAAAEEDEPEPFADDEAWAKFLDEAERDRSRSVDNRDIVFVEEGRDGVRRRKARKQVVTYDERLLNAVPLSDDEDSQEKKAKRKGKGKGEATDGDDEFQATAGDDSDSDADVFFDAAPDNLDLADPSDGGPRGLGPQKLSKAERKALQRRQQAEAQKAASDAVAAAQIRATGARTIVPLPTGNPSAATVLPSAPIATAGVAGPSTAPNYGSAVEQSSRPSHPITHRIPDGLTHDTGMSILTNGPMFRPTNPGVLVPATPEASPTTDRPRPNKHAGAIHAAKVASAREVLMNLRGAVNTMDNVDLRDEWLLVANTGRLPPAERQRLYLHLAVIVDDMLSSQGLKHYYTTPGNLDVVNYYISLGVQSLTDPATPVSPTVRNPAPVHSPPHPQPPRPQPPPTRVSHAPPPQVVYPHQMVPNPNQLLIQQQMSQEHQRVQQQMARAQMAQQQMAQQQMAQQQMAQQQRAQQQMAHQQMVQQQLLQQQQMRAPVQNMAGLQGPGMGHLAPGVQFRPPPPQPQQNRHVVTLGSSAAGPSTNARVLNPTPVVVQPPAPSVPGPSVPRQVPPSAHQPQQSPQQQQANVSPVQPQPPRPTVATGSPVPSATGTRAGTATPRTTIPLSSVSTPSGAPPEAAQGNASSLQMGDSSRIGPPANPPPNADATKCFWCQGDHLLRDCPKLVPLAELDKFEEEIKALEDGEDKEHGLNAIQQMRVAHAQNNYSERAKKYKRTGKRKSQGGEGEAAAVTDSAPHSAASNASRPPGAGGAPPNGVNAHATSPSAAVAPSTSAHAASTAARESKPTNGAPAPTAPQPSKRTAGQTAEEAILIDSDTEQAPPAKKQRTKSNSAEHVAERAPRSAGGNTTPPGCLICLSDTFHVARKCPVVEAGPESIEQAMKRFNPEDNIWGILSMIHRALLTGTAPSRLPKCPFCGGSCGQTVRQCAETRGSRKQLKAKIRQLEGPLRANEEKVKDLKQQRAELLAKGVYSAIDQTNLANLTSDINKIEQELEEVTRPALAPLYDAYLSWPKANTGAA